MTKLEKKIQELEARIKELEAKKSETHHHYHYPQYPQYWYPYYVPISYPYQYTTTGYSISGNTGNLTTTWTNNTLQLGGECTGITGA